MMHVSDFMTLHGAIVPFTQQGLEKYDLMTKDNFFFRSTSHHGEQCMVQFLQKQNRLEYLESNGAKWTKRHITCSNCHSQGHNKWTCKSACANCGEAPFLGHLVLVGRSKVPMCLSENTDCNAWLSYYCNHWYHYLSCPPSL